MNKKLYVGNLTTNVTEDDLKASFEQVGPVASVFIVKDKFSKQSKGFGFVEMETKADAYRRQRSQGEKGRRLQWRTPRRRWRRIQGRRTARRRGTARWRRRSRQVLTNRTASPRFEYGHASPKKGRHGRRGRDGRAPCSFPCRVQPDLRPRERRFGVGEPSRF